MRDPDAQLKKARCRICDPVKPGPVDSAMKPTSADSAEEEWIYIRGCRIKKAGLRFNSQGDVYVLDSEDEEEALPKARLGASVVDLAPAVAADGAGGVDLAPAVAADEAGSVDLPPALAADGAAGVDLPPAVAADGAAGVDLHHALDGAHGIMMNLEVAARLAKKVLGDDLHPEVAARLSEVLSKMKTCYHECFIDMYKVMVPMFFTPAP